MKSITKIIRQKLPTTLVFLIAIYSSKAFSATSYMLEITCSKESGVTYNRQFWANDDVDAQNKARAILASGEFQSKGGCSIKNLKKG